MKTKKYIQSSRDLIEESWYYEMLSRFLDDGLGELHPKKNIVSRPIILLLNVDILLQMRIINI